jgi:hypothetical protein
VIIVAFDVKSYSELKAKDLINKVERTNEDTPEALTYAVYIKKFEIDGTKLVQLADEVQSVTDKELTDLETALDTGYEKDKASIVEFKNDAV